MLETFLVQVLGCKVNKYDAQQIETLFEEKGLRKVEKASDADISVIHTCGVTAAAAQKSRQTIRRLQRENPNAVIAITGCAAGDDLSHMEESDIIRVTAGKDWLQNLAEQLEAFDLPISTSFKDVETDAFPVSKFGEKTRAYLKVQDGCDIGCSYCIIPQLRKAPRDKSIENAVQEATTLVENGYREIVVLGVSVGLYGQHSDDISLAKLLRELVKIPNMGRIRLSSLHPEELTDDLLDIWASSPLIMPHVHLSLQSGCNATLKRMRRGYTAEEYDATVQRMRAVLNNPAFTTDVIVGFPGETDEDFEESYEFCKKVGFSQLHTFTYSPRPKTPAATMPDQVNGAIATERSARLRELAKEMALSYHQSFLGQPIQVLVEGSKDGIAQGYSEHYVPVEFRSDTAVQGDIVTVEVNKATFSGLSTANKV